MEKNKEYYAFISYKREDEKWAKWLQNKLEHYRFPTNLNTYADLPKNIRPTFRDVTDLTPGLLAEEINTALCKSEWLIVICSPRSAKSPWVCKEAQTFIDLGRADRIIPFVIEGFPFSNDTVTECYPEALLKLTGSRELLAANINEMGREAAAIKVVARMFNLRFDALWQRYERELKLKRMVWIGGAILLAIIGLGIGSFFIKQNRMIESQNRQLELVANRLREDSLTLTIQKDSILSQNIVISSQRDSINMSIKRLEEINRLLTEEQDKVLLANWNLKLSNAEIISQNAVSLINNEGNLVKAQNLLNRICCDESASQLAALPNVEFALRKNYRESTREGIKMRFSLDNMGKISFAQFSKTENELFLILNNSLVTKYDANTGLLKDTVCVLPNYEDCDFWICDFDNIEGNLFYVADSAVYIRNIYSENNNCKSYHFSSEIGDVIVSSQYNYIICDVEIEDRNDFYSEYHLVDLNKDEENDIVLECEEVFGFSPDGRKIIADIDQNCCIYNLENNHIEKVISQTSSLKSAKFIGNTGRYILLQRYTDKYANSISIDIYDISSGELVDFAYKLEGDILSINDIEISPKENRMVTADFYGNLTVYDIGLLPYYDLIKNGIRISGRPIEVLGGHSEYIESISFSKSGNKMLTVSNEKICVWDVNVMDILEKLQKRADFIASNGQCYIKIEEGYARLYDVATNEPIGMTLFKKEPSAKSQEQIRLISRNQNIVAATKDSLIFIYDLKYCKWSSIPFNCHEYSLELSIDRNGERLAIWDSSNGNKHYHSLRIYDLKSNKEISKDESIKCAGIAISPNGEHLAVSTGNETILYYTTTLKQKMKFANVHTGYIPSVCYSPDGKYIATASSDRTVCLWDAQNGALIKTFYGADRELRECSISHDGKNLIASTSFDKDFNITNFIWNIESGQIVEIIKSHSRYSFCQDTPNKLYATDGDCHFLDFPSTTQLVDFFSKRE